MQCKVWLKMTMGISREARFFDQQKAELFKIPAKQLIILLCAAAVLSATNKFVALSVLAGGVVAVIPQLYFTVCAYRYRGAKATKEIVQSFYRGESGKFVLTLIGFAGIFLYFSWLKTGAVFVGYIVMQIIQVWLSAKAVKNSKVT